MNIANWTNIPMAFGEVGVKERVKNVLNYKKPAFWVIVVAVVACAVVTVCFATNPKQELSQEQHIDELRVKYPEYFELIASKGLEVYVWQMSENDYRFGLMPGTNREKILDELMALKGATAEEMALILSTYDIEDKSIFVISWQNPISSYMVTEDTAKAPEYINNIRAMLGLDDASMSSTEIDEITTQKLTLDDAVMLSQKGDALTWSDFEQYQGQEIGSGLYIMRYEIDELFDVLVGGVPNETPMYIRLRNQDINAWVDLREDSVERVKAFIEVYKK